MSGYIKRDEENMCDNCEYDYCPQCADETRRTDMNDYIKREDAIKSFVNAANQAGNIGDQIAFRMIISEIPTADVRENVRGEWIEKYYESNETGETVFHGMIMCSVCGHVPKVGWLSDFCPNCGAEMGGKS